MYSPLNCYGIFGLKIKLLLLLLLLLLSRDLPPCCADWVMPYLKVSDLKTRAAAPASNGKAKVQT